MIGKIKCPHCNVDGTFERKKIPWSVASFVDYYRERSRAKRTIVCPKCKTEIVFPRGTTP